MICLCSGPVTVEDGHHLPTTEEGGGEGEEEEEEEGATAGEVDTPDPGQGQGPTVLVSILKVIKT